MWKSSRWGDCRRRSAQDAGQVLSVAQLPGLERAPSQPLITFGHGVHHPPRFRAFHAIAHRARFRRHVQPSHGHIFSGPHSFMERGGTQMFHAAVSSRLRGYGSPGLKEFRTVPPHSRMPASGWCALPPSLEQKLLAAAPHSAASRFKARKGAQQVSTALPIKSTVAAGTTWLAVCWAWDVCLEVLRNAPACSGAYAHARVDAKGREWVLAKPRSDCRLVLLRARARPHGQSLPTRFTKNLDDGIFSNSRHSSARFRF